MLLIETAPLLKHVKIKGIDQIDHKFVTFTVCPYVLSFLIVERCVIKLCIGTKLPIPFAYFLQWMIHGKQEQQCYNHLLFQDIWVEGGEVL